MVSEVDLWSVGLTSGHLGQFSMFEYLLLLIELISRVFDDFDQWSVGLTSGHFAPFSFVSMTNGYSGLLAIFNCYKYISVLFI